MRVVAPHVLDENVGRVRLWREAVISDIDAHIGEANTVDLERVHTVGVGGVRLSSVSIDAIGIELDARGDRTDRSISRERMNVHIIKRDIISANEKVCPARRVQLRDALDRDTGCVIGEEEDGTVECVVRVLLLLSLSAYSFLAGMYVDVAYQNLLSSKLIIPFLPIAVQHTTPEDLDVLTTPAPEGDGLLEVVVEVVGLPVGDVVCELSGSNNISIMFHKPLPKKVKGGIYLNLPFKLHLNIIQEGQIQLLPDHIGLPPLQQ